MQKTTMRILLFFVLQFLLSAVSFRLDGRRERFSQCGVGHIFMIEGVPTIMINGMPGQMATEAANACIRRGFKVASIGFTGPDTKEAEISLSNDVMVNLQKGPGFSATATEELKRLKTCHPNLIVIDYTHPSAVSNNVAAYVEAKVDFVMGTTGFDADEVNTLMEKGTNLAVIAPNMAKQIVAVQYILQEAARKFPGSFSGFALKVLESHQQTKADTSGTAKAFVSLLSDLTGQSYNSEEIEKLRTEKEQLEFGVPLSSLGGHAFHTYQLSTPDNTVHFELKHNVCGRKIYAEGTADAVEYLDRVRRSQPSKRVFNMIDVLEAGHLK